MSKATTARVLLALAAAVILASCAVMVLEVHAAHAQLPPPYPTSEPNVPELNFDSDLDEDGVVEVCPGGVQAVKVDAAIADINSTTATLPGGDPRYVRAGAAGAWCEVKAVNQGGANASFYARLVFTKHPDQLQVSDRFANLPTAQKQGTVTHEHTHMGGENHPTASFAYFCANAVVSTFEKCKSISTPRRTTFGPEDAAFMEIHWGSDYPVHNKCWTPADANNDGVCDNFGPPEPAVIPGSIDGEVSPWVGSSNGVPVTAPEGDTGTE